MALEDELINREHFDSLAEARVLIREWRDEYNNDRPHSSLGDLTPVEFAARLNGAGSATLRRPRRKHHQALCGVAPN